MPLGRKVADIYAELNLDKDTIRSAMAAAGHEMGADADRLGRQLGDRMSKGMAGQVEQLSARLAKARLAEQKATDAVALAQARLTEANEKGNVSGSRLLALQQRLSQAEAALALAHDNTTRAATKHADAERRLAADVENLGKAIGPSADRAGRDTGDKLSQGIHLAIIRNSPLIAAGIGAALAAGAPVAIAGATALFAGIGIAAAAMNDEVQKRWGQTWTQIVTGTKEDASVLQRTVADMAGQVGQAFQQIRPLMQDAFVALAPILHDFTGSLLQAVENALPGLVHAVEAAGPVMGGLGSLVEKIGTGLGQ
ncbi:MAG: hypothetical protein HOQ45_20275, partial [Nocardioidaceae bacterium]|nr:hypothetical protein [Nocardioidaceae bacterium]